MSQMMRTKEFLLTELHLSQDMRFLRCQVDGPNYKFGQTVSPSVC